MKSISFENYLNNQIDLPILDVRSPGEYHKGHIPGAYNLPLFSDEERAEVGTLYKQKSKKAAVFKGLDIAGGKMSWYIKKTKKLIKGQSVCVHCWRGGKRSSSLATLLEFVGYEVFILDGGYKAYRNYILNQFKERKMSLLVLGGKTGSGKTIVLEKLKEMGEQVVDLEGLANHKGSAFGALGQEPQPTVEQFENKLYELFETLDFSKRVWVENESKSIGRVYVPDGFWQQMGKCPLIEMEVPLQSRIDYLKREYGGFSKEELLESLQKIYKRLGGQNVKKAIEAYDHGDLETATKVALFYYDKAYKHGSDKKEFIHKKKLVFDEIAPIIIAENLIKYANEQGY